MKPFFVLIYNRDGGPGCLMMDGDKIATFHTSSLAKAAVKSCPAAMACGYEIFEIGGGEG